MNRTLIIAEAGVNHNGSIELAKKLIDKASEAGVDYVKFQTFKAEKLVTKNAQKAQYQNKNIGGNDQSQLNMLKKLELSQEQHFELIEYCNEQNCKFFSTAFDAESMDFLKTLQFDFWKIPSGEITNFPYLRELGLTKQPVILSTGMANIHEVEQAINILVRFGTPRKDITLLHCTTEYPAPKNEVNLKAMHTMAEYFNLPVGYSDHTQGIEIPIAAVAMGATVIEKHFTLDRNMEGPDHKASLEPDELKAMVDAIRNVELALGSGIKEPAESEKKNIEIARKSIVAARDVKKGELLTDDNITAKRPAKGINPMEWESVVGTVAQFDFNEDEPIKL